MIATRKQAVLTAPKSAPRARLLHTDTTPLELALIDRASPERASAETFVRTTFAQTHGAHLDTFYPVLLRIIQPDGNYLAIAGLRTAGGQALFSEHYLDQPIEKILGAKRCNIIEVGNLALSSTGQVRQLICTLTAFLAGSGFSDVVFTAAPWLRKTFSRMGLQLAKLANARPDSLPDKLAKDWGSYYQNHPAVYSGDLQLASYAFTRLMTAHPELHSILRQAHTAGAEFTNDPTSENT